MKNETKQDNTPALPAPTHRAIVTPQYENVAPDDEHRTAASEDDDEHDYENGQFLRKFSSVLRVL